MVSSTFTSMLFLLLLLFSFHMGEALGAQTEIRKIKETIRMRRNLEGNDYKNSKMWMRRSYSPQCQQYERFKNMVTTNGDDDHGLDDPCFPFTCFNGWGPGSQSCTYTKYCHAVYGAPPRCSISENCSSD
ncbi:hypothetical protein ARALYDRAFT_889961 [Arabidopsis lyrata subsp. lyrata]|uniref:Uncharacterized protein n=1 Tax=Arabidopsis lyrata subsp. lyrata TaxID=81972 RepID=D7KPG7_ARALL|nr:hypothetical protein ARALYDRAFT_889961 [Arabidopsis lyrata subsp. lyrata]